MILPLEKIEAMIYTIRGQRVMLDSDLALLYEVETKVLNQAVKRHLDRFPNDFMFDCNSEDLSNLRSQLVTANTTSSWNSKRRSMPMVFTENGVAMLSTVLTSNRAIQINIAIIRTFTRLRSFLALESSSEKRIGKLEKGTNQLFKIVFERLDSLEDQITPKLPNNRKKIGLKSNQN